jgi:hypothetical protein
MSPLRLIYRAAALKNPHYGMLLSGPVSNAGQPANPYQFQIKDDLKAVRIEAARRTNTHVEQPQMSQRREGLDMELKF